MQPSRPPPSQALSHHSREVTPLLLHSSPATPGPSELPEPKPPESHSPWPHLQPLPSPPCRGAGRAAKECPAAHSHSPPPHRPATGRAKQPGQGAGGVASEQCKADNLHVSLELLSTRVSVTLIPWEKSVRHLVAVSLPLCPGWPWWEGRKSLAARSPLSVAVSAERGALGARFYWSSMKHYHCHLN